MIHKVTHEATHNLLEIYHIIMTNSRDKIVFIIIITIQNSNLSPSQRFLKESLFQKTVIILKTFVTEFR